MHSQAEPERASLGQARTELEPVPLARVPLEPEQALNAQRSFEGPGPLEHGQAEPEQAADPPEQAAHSRVWPEPPEQASVSTHSRPALEQRSPPLDGVHSGAAQEPA